MNDGTKETGRTMAQMMTITGALALGACGGLDLGGTDESGGDGTGGSCPEGNNGCDCKTDGSCNGDLTCDPDAQECRAMLEGHWVRCCYSGNYSTNSPAGPGEKNSYCGCEESEKLCLDPEEWDANQDGELSGAELQNFCGQRCTPSWNIGGTPPPSPVYNGWKFYQCAPEGSTSPHPGQLFASCQAFNPDTMPGLPQSMIEQEFACQPYKNSSDENKYPGYGESGIQVPPNFETDFGSSSSGSELEIWITDTELVPSSYSLNVQYFLGDCDDLGNDEWRCDFVLSSLDLSMPSLVFGDYLLQDVGLTLNHRVESDVYFFPYDPPTHSAPGYYLGSFELSEGDGNAVGTNLSWTQINRVKETSIDNLLHLGNTDGSLGGLDEIYGVFDLTPSGVTFRLIGYGTDSITSGDWASVEFDLIDEAIPLGGQTFVDDLTQSM